MGGTMLSALQMDCLLGILVKMLDRQSDTQAMEMQI